MSFLTLKAPLFLQHPPYACFSHLPHQPAPLPIVDNFPFSQSLSDLIASMPHRSPSLALFPLYGLPSKSTRDPSFLMDPTGCMP